MHYKSVPVCLSISCHCAHNRFVWIWKCMFTPCTLSCLSLSAFVLLLKHECSRIAGESVSPCTSTSVIEGVQAHKCVGACVCVFVRARAAVRVISNKCSVCSASPWQRRGRHAAPLLCLCGEINAAFFSCCEAATKQLFKTNSQSAVDPARLLTEHLAAFTLVWRPLPVHLWR